MPVVVLHYIGINIFTLLHDTEKHEVRRWRIGNDYGTIVAGGNGKGSHLNQLNCPIYIFVDQDHSVYIYIRF